MTVKGTKVFRNGLLWGVFLFFKLTQALGEEEVVYEKILEGHRVTFRCKDSSSLRPLELEKDLLLWGQLIQNLIAFEKEVPGSYFFKDAQFEFVFEGSDFQNPSNLLIKAFHPPDQGEVSLIKYFKIRQIERDDKAIRYLSLQPQEEGVLENVYQIYNLSYDSEGRVLRKVVLKNILDPSIDAEIEFCKFQEGVWIEYQDYDEHSQPASYAYQTFILSVDGTRIVLNEKKSFDRHFNEEGLLVGETTQETTYQYTGLNPFDAYAIYNVTFHPKGELKSYEILFPKVADIPFSERENLEINFERDDEGRLLKKLVRRYKIMDRQRSYSEGTQQEHVFDKAGRIRRVKEMEFEIKPRTSGLLPKERIPKRSTDLWNLSFDSRGQVLSRRILHSTYESRKIHQKRKTLRLFHLLKNVQLRRDPDKGDLKKVHVDYLDFSKEKKLTAQRCIRIDILETLVTGGPRKIRLLIRSKNPPFRDELIIMQDCSYILNEAISGELFYSTQERPFEVYLKKVTEDGKIEKVVFHPLRKKSD